MRGYLALTGSELRLFLREPFAVIFVLVFPLMMMLHLADVGVEHWEAPSHSRGGLRRTMIVDEALKRNLSMVRIR